MVLRSGRGPSERGLEMPMRAGPMRLGRLFLQLLPLVSNKHPISPSAAAWAYTPACARRHRASGLSPHTPPPAALPPPAPCLCGKGPPAPGLGKEQAYLVSFLRTRPSRRPPCPRRGRLALAPPLSLFLRQLSEQLGAGRPPCLGHEHAHVRPKP